mgnify:CR=1 FL=1
MSTASRLFKAKLFCEANIYTTIFFIMKLGMPLNYENTNGQTVLAFFKRGQ